MVKGFFDNMKNADKLCGLAGKIHDAVMAYQVCTHEQFLCDPSYVCTRLRYSKISTTRVVDSSSVPLTLFPFAHMEY